MTKTFLESVCVADTKFPKDLIIWNYWDHEHIVGTHFKYYKKVNILFEDEKVCFSERWAKLPFIPFYLKTTDLCVMVNKNQMDVFHYALFNMVYCKQTFKFEENIKDHCKVTKYDYLQVPKFMKFLQPVFNKIMQKWFIKVWEEDMPMRERRLKVWKLGFEDFKGIEYRISGELKNTDIVMNNTFWLGVQPTLNADHYDFIASKLEEFFGLNF